MSGVKSSWWLVRSAVPQGSVVGNSSIFFCDMDVGLKCILCQCVDNTNLHRNIDLLESGEGSRQAGLKG